MHTCGRPAEEETTQVGLHTQAATLSHLLPHQHSTRHPSPPTSVDSSNARAETRDPGRALATGDPRETAQHTVRRTAQTRPIHMSLFRRTKIRTVSYPAFGCRGGLLGYAPLEDRKYGALRGAGSPYHLLASWGKEGVPLTTLCQEDAPISRYSATRKPDG